MTEDSTIKSIKKEIHQSMKSPRISTVNFIRQYARAYVAAAGVALNGIIIN